MRDEDLDGGLIFGICAFVFIAGFLAIWYVIYLMMEAGIGMTDPALLVRSEGVVVERGIFDSPRNVLISSEGPDNYWLRLRNPAGIAFWTKLGDTDFAWDLWSSVELGQYCVHASSRSTNLAGWTCGEKE